MGQRCIVLVLAYMLIVLQSAAISIHRSFRTREVDFGGGVSASAPVEAKVAQALGAAAAFYKTLAYDVAGSAAREQNLGPWMSERVMLLCEIAQEQEEDVSYAKK